MKRVSVILCVVLLASLAVPALAVDGDTILGLWLTQPNEEDGNARIEIVKNGEVYEGKIVWLEQPIYPQGDEQGMDGQTKVDRENPDPALQERPVLGLQILSGFKYAGDGLWKGGRIYAPDDGKTYKCKMTLEEDGTLNVRGYIGFALLGRTSIWTRVEGE